MPELMHNLFNTLQTFESDGQRIHYYSLPALEAQGIGTVSNLPVSIRILLESLLRNYDNQQITEQDIVGLANWDPKQPQSVEIPFKPARVLAQDFTGVPLLVDLAAMRSAVEELGGDPQIIEPLVPVDLVIDHSVQVDAYGTANALQINTQREFERNKERYEFLKWGQQAFDKFRVIPPSIGIVHQVNLEYLAKLVVPDTINGETIAYPDTLVGTDSHTTMINGLGIVGWGVGGIEAEAAMLGQPVYILTPEVLGVHIKGTLKEGVTATDLVLTVVQRLRETNVVGKFGGVLWRGGRSPLNPRSGDHFQYVSRIRRNSRLLPLRRRIGELSAGNRARCSGFRVSHGIPEEPKYVRHPESG